jgi:hypothetical protein
MGRGPLNHERQVKTHWLHLQQTKFELPTFKAHLKDPQDSIESKGRSSGVLEEWEEAWRAFDS